MVNDMLLKEYFFRTCENCIWKILVALLIIGVGMSISACSDSDKNSNADIDADVTKTKSMEVEFINVGKGDCILVTTDKHVMMIDTGYNETSSDVIRYLQEKGIKKIDIMIITHYDKDHVGGASDIMDNIEVKAIYMPDYEGEGNKYKKFIKYLNNRNKMNIVNYVTKDISMDIEGVKLDLYPPKGKNYDTDNDYSIVVKLTNGMDSFLIPGDAEDKRIDELLGDEMLKCNVLKVPHHGVLGKNNIQFMEEAAPQYAIFTSDSEEDVSTSLIYALEQMDTKYFFNCNGNIICISKGDGNIVISQ